MHSHQTYHAEAGRLNREGEVSKADVAQDSQGVQTGPSCRNLLVGFADVK